MTKKLQKTYKKFSKIKNKKTLLNKFFNAFLPEAVYRNTKIEHPEASKKKILSFLK